VATPLNITLYRRERDFDGGIQVEWWTELEELRRFAFHGKYFEIGYTERQISEYATNVAAQAVFDVINKFFPGEFEPGGVV